MTSQDEVINDFLCRISLFSDKRKSFSDYKAKLLSKNKEKSDKWNFQLRDSIKNHVVTESKVSAIKIYNAIFEVFKEFNEMYFTKAELVSIYYESKLNQLHKCAVPILDRFNVIQNEGSHIAQGLIDELEYLLVIMRRIITEFTALINISYANLKISENMNKLKNVEEDYWTQLRNNQNKINIEEKKQIGFHTESIKQLGRNENSAEKNDVKHTENEPINISSGLSKCVENDFNAMFKKSEVNNDPEVNEDFCETVDLLESTEKVEEIFEVIWRFDETYCHNIRKMVNNMCSQITSSNPQHTISKLQQMIGFLQGSSIHLVGSDNKKTINLKEHPDAYNLFWYLLYHAILIQAETQFAVNIETTVTFASVAVSLFGRFPDRLEGLFQLIYDRYPVFKGKKGSCVEDEQFLVALRGVGRLIASMAVAVPPPGYRATDSLSVAFLWSLLASLEASTVQESVSAEAIMGLLEIGGNSLLHYYKGQFEKVLMALKNKFQPLNGISELALVLMIDDVLKKKKFEIQGYLTAQSWQE